MELKKNSLSVFSPIRENHNVLHPILDIYRNYLRFLKYMHLVNFTGDILELYGNDFKLNFKK